MVRQDRDRSIADLAKHLHVNETRTITFFLQLSKEEQRKHFRAHIDALERNWTFSCALQDYPRS